MPLYVAIPYFLCEALAFWGIASWLGVGWALVLLFVFFIGGLVLATLEMRRIHQQLARRQLTAGQAAGNYGLLAAGAVLVALPGFITSGLGLLLMISPTRAIIRRMMARRFRKIVEDMGVRSFEATNMYRQRASYGSFRDSEAQSDTSATSHPVIDPDELENWSRNVKPEDFNHGGSSQSPRNDGDNPQ